MRTTFCVLAVAILCGASTGSVAAQESKAAPMAALFSELSGAATIRTSRTAAAQPVRRFDTITAGATIAMGPRSRGVLVLVSGQRFELGSEARATVTAAQLTGKSGPVAALPTLPTLPRLAALNDTRPAGPPGSVRVRGEVISGLLPFHAVLATEPLTLRFAAVNGASKYSVQIETEAARRVFSVETTDIEVRVPRGIVGPGGTYYWTVETLDKVGGSARGMSRFNTLSLEDVRSRETLRQSLASDRSAEALAFAAEIDRRLGLYAEAMSGFRAALASAPGDQAIVDSIRQLEDAERAAR